MQAIRKVWGQEIIIVNDDYCAKFLCLDKGAKVSWHMHPEKKETMYGLEGTAELVVEQEPHLLTPFNRPKTISPGQFHSFYAVTDAVILEVSTHHSEDDTVRTTVSQAGEPKPQPHLKVISIDRDGVVSWGKPPGPITPDHIRNLKVKGYIVGTGGGASAEEQKLQWVMHGIVPDFALSKGELFSLKRQFPNAELIHVDNEPLVVNGFSVIPPEEIDSL